MRRDWDVAVGPVQALRTSRRNASSRNPCNGPPCWLLAGPLGCHEPTCQRAGVISQGGFRSRPLTNHVSPFLAGPEGSNPRPRQAYWVVPRTVYIAMAASPPSGYFGCLKRSAAVERWKGEGGPQWLAPRLRGSFYFFSGRCNFMKRTAGKYGAN